MREKFRQIALGSLFLLSLSRCAVNVPNVKACSTAGYIANGATCVYSLTDGEEQMDMDQWIAFLEATDTRGGAVCHSTEDYKKLILALKQACKILGSRCHYEEEIDSIEVKLEQLEKKVMKLL